MSVYETAVQQAESIVNAPDAVVPEIVPPVPPDFSALQVARIAPRNAATMERVTLLRGDVVIGKDGNRLTLEQKMSRIASVLRQRENGEKIILHMQEQGTGMVYPYTVYYRGSVKQNGGRFVERFSFDVPQTDGTVMPANETADGIYGVTFLRKARKPKA